MTLGDLSSLGSFISGIAVVVSLAYLSVQIRQNTRHSQALIQQGRAARIVDTALRIAELRADDGLNGCFEGTAKASAKDVGRFLNLARAVFVSAEDSFLQGEQGLLGLDALESYKASLRRGTGSPGLAAAWILSRDMYEPKFRAFMDEINGDLSQAATSRLAEVWRTTLASPAQTRAA